MNPTPSRPGTTGRFPADKDTGDRWAMVKVIDLHGPDLEDCECMIGDDESTAAYIHVRHLHDLPTVIARPAWATGGPCWESTAGMVWTHGLDWWDDDDEEWCLSETVDGDRSLHTPLIAREHVEVGPTIDEMRCALSDAQVQAAYEQHLTNDGGLGSPPAS